MAAPKQNRPAPTIFPIQVVGTPRQCPCGVSVRRGIMWEVKNTLHCSQNCARQTEGTPQ